MRSTERRYWFDHKSCAIEFEKRLAEMGVDNYTFLTAVALSLTGNNNLDVGYSIEIPNLSDEESTFFDGVFESVNTIEENVFYV